MAKELNDQQFIIICKSDGYYILDKSVQGILKRILRVDEEYHVQVGLIFEVFKVLFAVVNIDEKTKSIEILVIQGGLRNNEVLWYMFTEDKNEITIGKLGDIKIHKAKHNPHFGSFIFKENKIILKKNNNQQIWVNLKTVDQFNQSVPVRVLGC